MNYVEKLLDGAEVAWLPIGEVVLPTKNIKWQDTDQTYQYIDLTSVSIENKTITATSEINFKNAPSRAQKLIETDDVIFATTRPAQQRYCLVGDQYSGEVASTGYCVLRAKKEKVLPKWILHWISSSSFKNYVEEQQSGAAYPAISDGKVKAFEIPIPCPDDPRKSLEIQAEIVRILDAFTSLTARKKQYNYFRNQLLTFSDDEVEWKPLGEIGKFTYGYAAKAQPTGDARFVRITDINTNGKLIKEDPKYVDASDESKKYLLNKNDLLMARTGATFGKTMIFDEDYPAIYAGFLIKLSLDEKIIDPKFYWHFSQSEMFWNQAIVIPINN